MTDNSTGHTSTHDPERIELYRKFSYTWWNREGYLKPLHGINDLTSEFIKEKVIKPKAVQKESIDSTAAFKDIKVLEVGCGGGIIAEPIAKLGCTILGIDINSNVIEVAKNHASKDPSLTNLTYKLEDVEDHAIAHPEEYDVVILNCVLQHINNLDIFLKACTKCLKPGGSIFICAVGKTYLSWLIAVVLYEKIFRVIYPGVHKWEKMTAIEEVQGLLEKEGCRTKESQGLLYNFLTGKWFWVYTTSVVYVLHSIKYIK